MKKYAKWIIPSIFVVIIGGLVFSFSKSTTTTEESVEYTPAEEISDEQLKRTKISLYYLNSSTNEIIKDDALINSKDLIDEPARTLLNELSKKVNLKDTICPITEGTQINNVKVSKNIAEVDLTSEFFNHNLSSAEQEEKLIMCIANTLCQLNEINGVKILINGEPIEESNLGLNLSRTFTPDYAS